MVECILMTFVCSLSVDVWHTMNTVPNRGFVKCPHQDTRPRLMEWLAAAIECNNDRAKMQVNPLHTSSNGFAVNLSAVLLKLCEPFLDPDIGMMQFMRVLMYCGKRGFHAHRQGVGQDRCVVPVFSRSSHHHRRRERHQGSGQCGGGTRTSRGQGHGGRGAGVCRLLLLMVQICIVACTCCGAHI